MLSECLMNEMDSQLDYFMKLLFCSNGDMFESHIDANGTYEEEGRDIILYNYIDPEGIVYNQTVLENGVLTVSLGFYSNSNSPNHTYTQISRFNFMLSYINVPWSVIKWVTCSPGTLLN